MRLAVFLTFLTLAACAYDPLGIEPVVETDAETEPDGGDDVDLAKAASVEPGCAPADGWCNRTPAFREALDAQPQWPGYLSAISAPSSTGVWVAGQDFQILRWDGGTWVQEHKSYGEVKSLWVDAAGHGIAVGSDLGNPRKRRVLLRSPTGDWQPHGLPDELLEGELIDVWARVTDESARFWATTGTEVLIESDPEGAVRGSQIPGRIDAVAGTVGANDEVILYLGGPDGIGMRLPTGEMHVESVTAQAKSFFVDSDAMMAVGGREVWLRNKDPELGWFKSTPAGVRPLAACRSVASGSPMRVTVGPAGIYQRVGDEWVVETVNAPDHAVVTACASLPDGSGWAVGYVAPGAPGKVAGFVLERKAP